LSDFFMLDNPLRSWLCYASIAFLLRKLAIELARFIVPFILGTTSNRPKRLNS
jgi:hypothetical protein